MQVERIRLKMKNTMVPKRLTEEDYIRWGRKQLVKNPVLEKGLQFVDKDKLVDLNQIELLRA
jgi:hypothetical protein